MNRQAAANVATLIGQDVARNVELFDLSIQSVIDGVTDPDILYQEPGLRQKILFDKSATAPGLGAIVALDEKGDIYMDSWSVNPRAGNLADREYFLAHKNASRDLGLYISQPFAARLQGDIPSLSMSRRINKPDGSFGGVVSGTIKISYFEHLFAKVSLGQSNSLVMLKDNGTLIAHNETIKAKVGADWSSAPVFQHFAGHTKGAFVSDRSLDGIDRLYAFQRVGDLPLVIVVGISTHQILAPWWSKMLLLAGIFTIMAASVVLLVWLLEAELRRRATAEAAAEELARIDGLTKLANRRWFDEELSRKWASAAREGQPMSLLMIDVDYFKPFNDTYGHQEGDRALKAVAEIIRDAVRRPDDVAARYGGEEFAVLLPGTDLPGATQIAQAICSGVQNLRIGHSRSEHKAVTVSIGVATVVPRAGLAKSALVDHADAALYSAKDCGRNIVRFHNVASVDFTPQISRAS